MTDDYDRPRERESSTSGKAIASLILGILSLCIPVLGSIAAIIFGALGLMDIGRSRGRLRGQGLAIAGIVMASITLLVSPVILIALLLPAVQKVREAANRAQSANNMMQIGLAFHNYHDTYKSFPPAVVYSQDGKPLYSWRVLILPFLGEDRLYKQFKLDEPWDSATNRPLLAQMPRLYVHPSQGQPVDPYATFYQVFTAEVGQGPWEGRPMFDVGPKAGRITFAAIVDGTSNTIMVVEATDPVPWSQPTDLPYAPDQPLPKLGLGSRTFNALMADGSVHALPKDTDERTIRALITRNGGEMVEVPGSAPPPAPAKKSAPKRTEGVFKDTK